MFLGYCLFYAGFVTINLWSAALMERTVLWGLNLATVYGFALIFVALVMAVIYNSLCGKRERLEATRAGEGG